MNNNEILSHIDHTFLRPVACWQDIVKLCNEALKYHTASVCVPPAYVKRIYEKYGNTLNICTAIGFPLGYSTTATKIFEATDAVNNGATEIDMVINITDIKNGDFESVKHEISAIRKAIPNAILKVIIETCFLEEHEKIALCQIITETGADYIKTSTGFGSAGATLEDILLFKAHIGSSVKIKAAGGIRTLEDMQLFLENGCARLGTSSAELLF